MRTRLLDAAVDCLVEYGYGGTTTPRIAARAGVTRGAQVHHFPTKTDLVVAAINHLANKRIEATIRKIDSVSASEDPAREILEVLWDVHQGPVSIATVELWVAARTDRLLASEMRRLEEVVTSALVVEISQYLPDEVSRSEFLSFAFTAMDSIRGILVASFVDKDGVEAKRRWGRTAANLLPLARESIGGWQSPPTPPLPSELSD